MKAIATISIIVNILLIGYIHKQQGIVEKYEDYYNSSETLLDSLEEHFNWCDRYDSDTVFNYCEIQRNIRNS